MQLIPNIGLAKFKLHPTKKAQENPITCVLAHNVEAFYTVTPERMKELLEAESKLRTAADFKAELQEMAKKDKRSLNKFIEKILEDHIDNFKADQRLNQKRVSVNLGDL